METIFNYSNKPIRTITDENEQTWFIAKDVCDVLDYQNTKHILEKKIDDDEKKLDYLTDSSGQKRKTWTINEFGLYSLILTSTKPEAKAFKRWVTHEVLPSIRKAGKFTTEQEQEHEFSLQKMADIIQGLKNDKEYHQKQVNDLRKIIEEKTKELIHLIKMDRTQLRLEFPNDINLLNN